MQTLCWGDLGEASRVDTVSDDVGGAAVLRAHDLLPHRAHDQDVVGVDDRLTLAVDEGLGREVVDVVHGADDGDGHPFIPDARRGTSRDAVLRVHEVELAGDSSQTLGHRIDRGKDLVVQGRSGVVHGDQGEGHLGATEELAVGWAEGDKVYVHPQLEQCLGKAQGVDYAAAGLCRVREDREAKWSTHRSTVAISGDRAAIAAHTRAARAAVSVTMHPASTSAATCDP
ncbi:unannotated protein [freshwater metagenome]|uniref:Unannotated protein n=1 Tax=freshwater metagenome TaxID=449393 RepID=A0A6J7SJA6_9ZZZZ